MAGLWDGERMGLEEVHRFQNGAVEVSGTLRWDIDRLWREIESGLGVAARRFGDSIVSMGADTWGVDFVLLGADGQPLQQPYCYRDARTRGMLERIKSRVSHEEIFAQSGLQFLEINSLYQLLALQEQSPEVLAAADRFLMIPDYLHYRMCGAKVGEFTNATTTQFFHPTQKTWSRGLLERLGLPTAMLPEVVQPGTRLGPVLADLRERTGLGAHVQVVAPATHDTGSAVAAVPGRVPAGSHLAYISSGTWSLLGVELPEPLLSEAAFKANLTNEGGVDGTYRLLKNIMGLWLVQNCKRAFEKRGSRSDYPALVSAAEASEPFRSLVDPDHDSFLSPADMTLAMTDFCRRTGQPVPETEGQFVRCALESLALKYAVVLESLVALTGSQIPAVNIVGGGSRNRLLNQFTANATGRPVYAGPVEATALGNLLVQARAAGEIASLDEIRRISAQSGALDEFLPADAAAWADARGRFASVAEG